jgi:hypothetical protein
MGERTGHGQVGENKAYQGLFDGNHGCEMLGQLSKVGGRRIFVGAGKSGEQEVWIVD